MTRHSDEPAGSLAADAGSAPNAGRFRLADRIAHAMIEHDYGDRIMWGDGLLNDAIVDHVRGRLAEHPLDRMIAACNALERAPDLFRKYRAHGCDSRNRARVVRGFQLIGTPRPFPAGDAPNPQAQTPSSENPHHD